MQGMHELCQPERVFQDPRKEEGLMEAQFIGVRRRRWRRRMKRSRMWRRRRRTSSSSRWREEEQVEEGDEATFSFSWSGVPWRKWLLLQHPVSPRALWVSGPLPMPWLLVRGANMKSMASAGKMKC